MYHIVIYDDKSYIRNRLRSVLGQADIRLHEATSLTQLVNLIDHDQLDASLIIADLNFDDPPSVASIQQFISAHKSIPLVFYTSFSSRRAFVTAVRIGAADFILKSTEDSELVERIRKNLTQPAVRKTNNAQEVMVILDIHHYLAGEIRKAQKGKYSLTVCFSTLVSKDSGQPGAYQLNEGIYRAFRDAYWETDVLLPYGNSSFISIFPFCGPEGKPTVEQKLQGVHNMIGSNDQAVASLSLVNEYVTFPNDGLTRDEILMTMEQKMHG